MLRIAVAVVLLLGGIATAASRLGPVSEREGESTNCDGYLLEAVPHQPLDIRSLPVTLEHLSEHRHAFAS